MSTFVKISNTQRQQLTEPKTLPYTTQIESAKQLLAYLKIGCEIKQVGQNKRKEYFGEHAYDDPNPDYYLIDRHLRWECKIPPEYVQALETLELLEMDSACDDYWISKASFTLPEVCSVNESQINDVSWELESEREYLELIEYIY